MSVVLLRPGLVASMYGPHVAQPPGVEPEQPKFERDFIMLSEFSELVGPVPVVSLSVMLLFCSWYLVKECM